MLVRHYAKIIGILENNVRMKKVLQINIIVGGGSTGNVAEQIGQLAMKAGWESWIAYSAYFGDRPSKSNIIKIGSKWDFYMHAFLTRVFDNHGQSSKAATFEFLKVVDTIKPDIIHLHNIHGYYLNYKLLFDYINQRNIPVVWTFHDCWPMTGHCSHFIHKKCFKWKSICENCPLKYDYPQSIIVDRSRKNYLTKKKVFTSINKMAIVPVSDWLSGIVKESFFKDYPIRTIYNGIDMSIFKEYKCNLRKKLGLLDKFIILGVAKFWDKGKGLDDYIAISKRLPNDTIIILIGADKKVGKMMTENMLPVKRTQTQQELIEYYSNADVVLNISYAETFGLPTIEGMACGTPAIVYDNTAIPETVTPETGIVVKTGDIDALLEAIKEVRRNGREYYSAACKKRAMRYDKDLRFKEYIELYDNLIK